MQPGRELEVGKYEKQRRAEPGRPELGSSRLPKPAAAEEKWFLNCPHAMVAGCTHVAITSSSNSMDGHIVFTESVR